VFTLFRTTPSGRRGSIGTPHGTIETPFFMPVGTAGAMKGLTHGDLLDIGAQILLCNTYHLRLHPGAETIRRAGGLHAFIGWNRPILTDSGGFQVFSLRRQNRVTDSGVHFRSHVNGDALFMGPEESIAIQMQLGADIVMCFDECPPSTAPRGEIEAAVDRTLRWARTCKETHERLHPAAAPGRPALFGIVQGGLFQDLRIKCAQELIAMGFDGYAVGGLAVGESEAEMFGVLDTVCPVLPEDKPRYLMGVGVIRQMQACVARGIDMFDCVLPQRIGRHGTILLSDGSRIRITNAAYRDAHEPIDSDSPSGLSRTHTKAYLHHLMKTGERLGETIAAKQNLAVTLRAMRDLRQQMESHSVSS